MNPGLNSALLNPIREDMQEFRLSYKENLNSDVKLINTVINYISRKKGKQLRPALCLLAARSCGEPGPDTFRAAALIEMIHVATLIHDDVVDEAHLRRGWPSVNRIWKSKISILVGDFMFSKALSNMIHLKSFPALEILSKTAERLSQGEILQIEKAIKKDMDEQSYYRMVGDKTASLFAASCKLGAITVTENQAQIQAMAKFGEKFGLVFQIKDDLLDITGNIDGLGKPAGFDLKKNILTLPLIYLFSKMDKKERKSLKRKFKLHVKRSELKQARKLIIAAGGVDYAEKQLEKFSNEAIEALKIIPDSEYKDSMIKMLNFNRQRDN